MARGRFGRAGSGRERSATGAGSVSSSDWGAVRSASRSAARAETNGSMRRSASRMGFVARLGRANLRPVRRDALHVAAPEDSQARGRPFDVEDAPIGEVAHGPLPELENAGRVP